MQIIAPILYLLIVGQGIGLDSYRLLYAHGPSNRDPILQSSYAVSVDHAVTSQNVQAILCAVVRQERPTGNDILAISIYRNLEEFVPSGHGTPEQDDRLIAT